VLSAVLLSAVLLLGVASIVMVRDAWIRMNALERARTTAELVEAIGTWSSDYHGVWVLSDASDPTLQIGEQLDQKNTHVATPGCGDRVALLSGPGAGAELARLSEVFYLKAPSHVQREVGKVFDKLFDPLGAEQIRLTSDRLIDARNAPNRFEADAIERLRTDETQAEYHEFIGSRLAYARRLTAQASCLRCHGSSQKGPQTLRGNATGSRGWNVGEGGFAGIVSLSIPLRSAGDAGIFARENWPTWMVVAAFAAALAAVPAWPRRPHAVNRQAEAGIRVTRGEQRAERTFIHKTPPSAVSREKR